LLQSPINGKTAVIQKKNAEYLMQNGGERIVADLNIYVN
jgi:hypothetical protein